MTFFFMFCILFKLFTQIDGQFCSTQDNCRQLEFKPEHTFNDKRLKNHVIASHDVMDRDFCEIKCYMEHNCVSYNLKKVADEHGRYKCELNNSTFEGQENKLETNSEYIYRGAKNACLKKPCRNNATCQTGLTSKGYRCLCTAGFKGSHCGKDIDECTTGSHNCSVNAVCSNTKGSYNCSCKLGYHGDGINCTQSEVSSCKEIYDKKMSNVSQMFTLTLDSTPTSVLCQIGDFGCGDGGWTPVLKIDGSKLTFHYDSNMWSNKETVNLVGAETGFDEQETKLPTYWNTSFSKICLGMKSGGQMNFIVMNKQASSLFSLIADGHHRATSIGRDSWKKLIGGQGSLQPNCNRQGFNVKSDDSAYAKARIGIISNNEDDCNLCDSRIGFGTGGIHDDLNTCGNEAISQGGDNGEKHITAMGFIFVQ